MSYKLNNKQASTTRLLCVEDNPDDLELMALALERAAPHRRFELHRVEEAEQFEQALKQPFDVVLCDYHLPRFSPRAALEGLKAARSDLPLVVVTRAIGEQAAVEVLRQGARDYVTKDRLGTLPQVIDRVLHERAEAADKARLSAELEAAYQRLQALSARLVAAQEQERNQISQELQEQLAQGLAGMVMHLHAARASTDPAQASSHADTAIQIAQSALDRLRSLSFSLRPPQLDLLGLPSTLETVLDRIATRPGLRWRLATRGQPGPVDGDDAALAVRLVTAAATNVVQHAQATRLGVRLHFRPDGRLGLLVADDGIGFDSRAAEPGSLALLGERAELSGGRVRVRSRTGRGCAVRAIL